ncbi:MAG: AarF/ABC1/UbiB kinase family protein [Deltaproteobacteria bacterium]|nr:AarF/ABC1/UbiB kinase family protein [Deltaproteobacteria bacterium]
MPATIIRHTIGDLRRITEIIQIAVRFGFGPILERARILERLGLREPPAEPPAAEPAAVRFRKLLESLGPTYIKFGQILSSRPDIVPRTWMDELANLQDNVSPMSFGEFSAELARGLSKDRVSLFKSVSETPLASASIAQVHRALTGDGRDVVLKVRRPGIRENVRADMDILYYLALALQATVEEAGIYNPTGIVAEFEKAMNAEMDFENEGRNIRRFGDNFAGSAALVIPKLHPDLCAENVLCMEYIEGTKITEVPGDRDREVLARHVLEGAFKQVYEDGFFHADPHPGNILALPDNRVALLDFGQVGELTKTQKEMVVSLSLAIALKDSETIARIVFRAAHSAERVKLARLRADIENLLDKYIDMSLDAVPTGTLLQELVQTAVREKLRLPPEYTLLAKGSVTVEGIVRRLAPDLNVESTIKPYAQKLLMDRYSPEAMPEALLKLGMRGYALLQDIPLQIDQIVSDIEEGKLHIRVSGTEIDEAGRNVRAAGFTVAAAVIAAAFIAGGFFCLASERWQFGAAGIAIGCGMGFAAFVWHVLAGIKWRKINILTFLKHGPGARRKG